MPSSLRDFDSVTPADQPLPEKAERTAAALMLPALMLCATLLLALAAPLIVELPIR